MRVHPAVIDYDGPIVIVGFGSIGKGSLPLILRHIHADRERMVVVDPDDSSRRLCELEGVRFEKAALRPDNYREILTPIVSGGFLVNLSVDVSSAALIALCHEIDALYIDTCIEPWAGGYLDHSKPLAARTNYALREEVRAIRSGGPTAIIAHGANPGMVSHLYKRALVRLAADMGHTVAPETRREWAELARGIGVKGIHIAERDSQWADVPKRVNEFVNTWSVEGFISEGLQPAELGWGTHERKVPPIADKALAGLIAKPLSTSLLGHDTSIAITPTKISVTPSELFVTVDSTLKVTGGEGGTLGRY